MNQSVFDIKKCDFKRLKIGSRAMLLLLFLGAMFGLTGCFESDDGLKKYSRLGETITVPHSKEAVNRAVVIWASTLTNGYSLFDDSKARENYVVFRNDSATVFVLENEPGQFKPWGTSLCLTPPGQLFFGMVIIRLTPATDATQISVAIHARRVIPGKDWNVHTWRFDQEKIRSLPQCAEDEQQVLNSIRSKLN